MKLEKIIEAHQPNTHKQLNKNRKHNKKKSKRGKKEKDLSFFDFENMMKHDSYYRGKGGSIKQRS